MMLTAVRRVLVMCDGLMPEVRPPGPVYTRASGVERRHAVRAQVADAATHGAHEAEVVVATEAEANHLVLHAILLRGERQ